MLVNVMLKTDYSPFKMIDRVERKNRRVLFRLGGYTRTIMKRLIRVRKRKVSSPGRPPFARSAKSPLRRLIAFKVTGSESVATGPLLFRSRALEPGGGKTGAQLLNEGGSAVQVNKAGRKSNVMRYRARPFIEPARKQALPKLIELIKATPL